MLANGAEADFTVLKYLERPRTALDFVVPDAWKKYVHPSGYRGLGWQGKWKDLRWVLPVWLLGAVGLLWPWEMKLYECKGEKVQYMLENEALNLCLDLPGKKVVYLEWLVRDAILKGNINLADSLLSARSNPVIMRQTQTGTQDTAVAETGPPPDLDPNNPPPPPSIALFYFSPVILAAGFDSLTQRLYAEGDKNIAGALFNRGVMYYEAGNKDSACYYFYSAVEFDRADNGFKKGLVWCELNRYEAYAIPVDTIYKSGFETIEVEGGLFVMGDKGRGTDECPYTVRINDFRIGKYEVTQSDWKKIMGNTPSFEDDCPDCPVDDVSWNDVQSFIKKLNALTGKQYRLPTEEEWEFAARGGRKSGRYRYAGSNAPQDVGWYNDVSNGRAHPVGLKKPNELGLYDMSGNVWEWCQNESQPYPGCQVDKCENCRVLRGGSWYFGATHTRVANRDRFYPDRRSIDYGFRLAEGNANQISAPDRIRSPVEAPLRLPTPGPDSMKLIQEPANPQAGDSASQVVSDGSGGTNTLNIVGEWVTNENRVGSWKLVFRSDGTCQTGFHEGSWYLRSSTWKLTGNTLVIEKSGLVENGVNL
ncbi:MAG: SUMF1/EgtB/PvdO family nonheme iron enzyme [Lewinellaceae bacterium]|nr:SUMF1/EgtB/PvdO family nonheme iron enzyme [Lewinellaceae bacterium]